MEKPMQTIRSLVVALIQPSRYDEDGFVIRYLKGVLPSNTLACLRSLTLDFAPSWKSEKGITVSVEAFDEMVERIPVRKLSRMNRGNCRVVAALVGVQSNQYPRASDLAKELTASGIKTLIGGFHVSGIISMFGEPTPEIRELMDLGVTIVHGEAEGRWESILLDIVGGTEKALYTMDAFPVIAGAPIPQPAERYMKKFALPFMGTVDCSRGCPFNCSFCTVVNVQGHKMRFRNADKILATVRENYPKGITEYFFTDDNFARNPEWEKILDGMIQMREEEGMRLNMMMQVDTRSHQIPRFTEKAGRAGCTQVFIGMESINPRNLEAVSKLQNNVDDYAPFIEAWHRVGVMTHVGYIIGFPFDTPDSVREDIRRLKDEIKVDQASFFMLTPLPGSRDHLEMTRSGVRMDPDLNKYDSFHVVMDHPRMTAEEWVSAYNEAWESFYSFENMRLSLMRAGRHTYWGMFKNYMWYRNSLLEPRHPMVAGFVRRKSRHDIRPGATVMGFWQFHFQNTREMFNGFCRRISLFMELQELWLLTRHPDDPALRLVANFAASVHEAKHRIASVDIRAPYPRWCDEITATYSALSDNLQHQCRNLDINGKLRRKADALMEDMAVQLERFTSNEQYSRSVSHVTAYLNRTMQNMEEFALKKVAHRRKVTRYWILTRNRIREGKILQFLVSLPRLIMVFFKDIRMSAYFLFHLLYGNYARHK